MTEVNIQLIKEAAHRLKDIVPCSSIKESMYLKKRTGLTTHLKLENLNVAGSFKIRGAANALLQTSEEDLDKGVIAASAGNHAQGVAYICRTLNKRSTIFMPERTPLVKAEATRDFGAKVVLTGNDYDEAYQAAHKYQSENGGIFIHPFADYRVICGQGTIGLELFQQIQDLGVVIASIGGGGLISGVACALKAINPKIKVLGVQTQAFPAMQRSFKDKRLVSSSAGSTIADGIAVKNPLALTFDLINQYVDDIFLVDEEAIASAVMDLIEWDHLLAEGAGAAPVAALLQYSKEISALAEGRSVACVISGGNMDVNLLSRIIPHGMIYSGRLMRIAVRIPDKPGRLADLLNVIGRTGANLLEVQHNRQFGVKGYEDVEVHVDLETTNRAHQEAVSTALKAAKFKFSTLEI